MPAVNSLGIFVGTGICNARCKHCAGVPLRKYTPVEDGVFDKELVESTIRNCYKLGARSLSISSSGEPTLSPLSVTKLFDLLKELKEEHISFPIINLYSNGIRIGEDDAFASKYLPLWKEAGLTTIYVTVHSLDEKRNAEIYGVKAYPSIKLVVDRIHAAGLKVRANLVLSKNNIGFFYEFLT